MDKSAAYVYRALKLTELPDEAKMLIAQGVFTAGHGHQIMRAPAEQRVEIIEYACKTMKVRAFPVWELRNHIDNQYSADLDHAIFPKKKAYAGEIACDVCPFNSANQGQLFDGAPKGKCNNTECFKKKMGTFMEDYSKAQAAEHPGLQYLGIKTIDYTGTIEGLKRAVVVGTPNSTTVRKLMKEQPEKFGWAVIAPRNMGDKPTTSVICMDRKVMAEPRESGQAKGEARQTRSGSWARETFINGKVEEAIMKAIADTVEPRKRFDFTEAQWTILLTHVGHDEVTGDRTDRASAQALLCAAVAAGSQDAIKLLGLNSDKIVKEATKDAEKEWEKLEPGK